MEGKHFVLQVKFTIVSCNFTFESCKFTLKSCNFKLETFNTSFISTFAHFFKNWPLWEEERDVGVIYYCCVKISQSGLIFVSGAGAYPSGVTPSLIRLYYSRVRELLLKGKAQYSWPPSLDHLLLYNENIIYPFYKSSYLNFGQLYWAFPLS